MGRLLLKLRTAACARIASYLDHLHGLGFIGTALVAVDGESIHAGGYGLADRETQDAFDTNTVVPIHSIAKMFTAATVFALEDAGELSTGDPIARFLPETRRDKASITIRQLLEHSAGLPEYSGRDDERIGRHELLRRLFETPLAFEAGTRQAYSNPGYSLLAAIVEQVAGTDLESYLRDGFFLPAGMRHTGLALPDWSSSSLAHAYDGSADLGTMLDLPRDGVRLSWNIHGNGGLLSTAEDMFRWSRAMGDPGVVPASVRHSLQTLLAPPGAPGMGIAGGEGFSEAFFAHHDDGVFDFTATNQGGEVAAPVGIELGRLASGLPVAERPMELPRPPRR